MSSMRLKRATCFLLGSIVAGTLIAGAAEAQYPAPEDTGPDSHEDFPWTDGFQPPVADLTPDSGVPHIAEWTRQNDRGETMMLTGEDLSLYSSGSDEGRDTSFIFYGEGAPMAAGLIQRLDGRQCALTLPTALPPDEMYLMWPRNGNGYGEPVAINRTEAWWIGPDETWAGNTFSVYGKSLSLGGASCHLYIEGYGWIESVSANPYKADFMMPNDISTGTYNVWAHNGHGGQYGWSEALNLTAISEIKWDAGVFDVTDYGADGSDSADDLAAFRAAVDASGSWGKIYCPPGTYYLSDKVQIPGKRMLAGSGMDNTVIKAHPSFDASILIELNGGSIAIKDIELNQGYADVNVFGIKGGSPRKTHFYFTDSRFSKDGENQNAGDQLLTYHTCDYAIFRGCEFISSGSGGHLLGGNSGRQYFFEDCDFYGINDCNSLMANSAEETCIYNCTAQPLDASDTSEGYGWAKGRWMHGGGNPSKFYLGGNRTSNMAPRPPSSYYDSDQPISITPYADGQQTFTFASFDPILKSHNGGRLIVRSDTQEADCYNRGYKILSYDYNAKTVTIRVEDWLDPKITATDFTTHWQDTVDQNSGEEFLWEAMSVRQRTHIQSITDGTTVVLEELDEAVAGCMLFITEGKGMGQAVRIVASDLATRTIVLERPFRVEPNPASVVKATEALDRFVLYGNTFNGRTYTREPDNNTATTAFSAYGTAIDTVFANNHISDLEVGVYYWSSTSSSADVRRRQTQPNLFSVVENNTIVGVKEGISHVINDFNRNDPNYQGDVTFFGHVVRNNSISNCTVKAFGNYTSEGRQRKDLCIYEGNRVADVASTIGNVDNLHNQVWLNNRFKGSGTGTALPLSSGHVPALRGNEWLNFSTVYGGTHPGAVLELPVRVASVSEAAATNQIPVFNSGTAKLNWNASSDSSWLTVVNSVGTVADEHEEEYLVLAVDESSAPTAGTEAVITVTDDADSDQSKQITVVYGLSETLSPPPPDGPPAPILTDIEISGAMSVNEETTSLYTCIASWSDGTTTTISPTWSENSSITTISAGGLLTADNVASDEIVTVSASYNGMSDTLDVTINYVEPTFTGISISGPSSLEEETSAQYTCTASYSDGTSQVVDPTWDENSLSASISSSGLLSAGDVTADQSVTITASFGGMSDTHTVTINYVAPSLVSIAITGATSVDEGTSEQYICTASWSDGTSTTVVPSWDENSASASISSSGLLKTASVSAETSVLITASYGGRTDTQPVTINDSVPNLMGIAISGPVDVTEETTAQYTCIATYSDGTSSVVTPAWNENSTHASISGSGLLTADNVTADASLTITASYGGMTDTQVVAINYVAPTLLDITIAGPVSMDEETTEQYACIAAYSDGTTSNVVASWSATSAFASIGSDGVLTAGNVLSDQSVILTASFGGETDTHTVSILYVEPPVVITGISISGLTVMDENSTVAFTCTASYSDGTTATVQPSWADDAGFAVIDSGGVMSCGNITADNVVTVTAKFNGYTDTQLVSVRVVTTQVVYPLSEFEGKRVWARLWDEAAQEWYDLGETVDPSELVIENVNPDQWYWISIKEFDESNSSWVTVHSNWLNM